MRQGDAVVMAGGKSSRMGQDKALMAFGGYSTLAEYQYRKLEPLFARVWLSAKSDKFPFDAPLIRDRHAIASPLGALASILETIERDEVFLLSVDMPGIDAQLIARLRAAARSHPDAQAIVSRSPSGREPLCAIYRPSALEPITAMLHANNHRLNDLLDRLKVIDLVCKRQEIFLNLNTPDAYATAVKRFGQHP